MNCPARSCKAAIAAKIGVSVSVSILPGCSPITHARNQLVRDYSSGADRLMFIDADVAGARLANAGGHARR